MLACYRLPLLKSDSGRTTPTRPRKAADSFGGAVVMKVMSADVVHKYDAGGVILNVHGGEEARAAYQKILTQRGEARARREDRGHPGGSRWPARASK